VNLRNKKLNLSLDLDVLLLTIAFIYLGCVLLWLFRQDRLKLPFAAKPTQPPAATKKSPAVNREFIDYLRRSFNRLQREKTAAVPSVSATLKAPNVVVPRPSLPVPQSPPTVVERIYVPMYPPTQSPPVQSVPSKVPVAPAKVTPPPPPSVATSSVPGLAPVPRAVPSPVLGYTLVGLLESGDFGYALFKVNGMAQRFEKGDPIGGSGWTLAAVKNQTAIISRNGQQRAIEVGQSF
jgi:hypothetical protein